MTTKIKPIAVSVENLTVSYGPHVVLKDINFRIESGMVAAIIGPNGSGKTTLMRAMLDLTPTTSGDIRFFNQHLHEARNRIGYVPQRFAFERDFPITVHEYMDLARHTECPLIHVEECIKEVGLTPLVLNKRLGDLSGGQLQRVLIAQAILNQPDLLFLDEPSTGIDIVGEAALYEVIEHLNKEHGTTILLVSHDIAMVSKLVDTVICVNQSLRCAGPPGSVLSDTTLGDLFGTDARLYQHTHSTGHKEPKE